MGLYMTSRYQLVIYNNSGQTVQKLSIHSKWLNEEIRNFEHMRELHYTIFAPFSKSVRITVENPNQIRSAVFQLKYPLSGEQYNQVEIGFAGELKVGALGR
jgi:hypothetical protein